MRINVDKIFNVFNICVMIFVIIIILYPVWYIVVLSFNDAQDAMRGGIYFWPRVFSFANYSTIIENPTIYRAFGISVLKTLIGVITHVLFTGIVAYGISKRHLRGRKLYITIGLVTMFFSGGMIPTFLLIRDLNLLNTFWVYIIPAMFSFYNLIIFQSFFRELPPALEESAIIDGANYLQIFVKIILPLSMPVMATIALFVGVGQWNDFFTAVLYVDNQNLHPIQTFLYRIIAKEGNAMQGMDNAQVTIATTSQSLKLSTMIITTLPILFIYPFLQKYFVKGAFVGSVKG